MTFTKLMVIDFLVFLDKDKNKLYALPHSTSTYLVLEGHKRTHTTIRKDYLGDVPPVVWPTVPGLGGLSIRKDYNIGINS